MGRSKTAREWIATKCVGYAVFYAVMLFDWQCLFLHTDCSPLLVFVVSTEKKREVCLLSLNFILQWGTAERFLHPFDTPLLRCPRCGWVIYVWWIKFCLADSDDRTVVVKRSERSWPKVNSPILTRLLHDTLSSERSFAPSARMWGSVCERVHADRVFELLRCSWLL